MICASFTPAGQHTQLQTEEFDEVVLATQANVSRRVLRTDDLEALAALHAFEYETHRVVLHTDPRLMPAVKSDWSPLNIQARGTYILILVLIHRYKGKSRVVLHSDARD